LRDISVSWENTEHIKKILDQISARGFWWPLEEPYTAASLLMHSFAVWNNSTSLWANWLPSFAPRCHGNVTEKTKVKKKKKSILSGHRKQIWFGCKLRFWHVHSQMFRKASADLEKWSHGLHLFLSAWSLACMCPAMLAGQHIDMPTINYAMALLRLRPLLLSTSICLMDQEVWIVEYADYQLFIHSVVFIVLFLCFNVCNDSFWSHDIYCSVHHGEGSSSVLSWRVLTFFSPEGLFGSFSWSDVRSKVREVYVYRL